MRINAAVRGRGMNYSQFIFGLKASNIELDRKTLAYLALEDPILFDLVCDEVRKRLQS